MVRRMTPWDTDDHLVERSAREIDKDMDHAFNAGIIVGVLITLGLTTLGWLWALGWIG